MRFLLQLQDLLDTTRKIDFLGPLALRIYLAPIFILAGYSKLTALDSTAHFFGAYLGMPAPYLMAVLAASAEFFGGIALLIGLATRWFAIPLMITMIVAAGTAHWENGWHALPESHLTMPWEWRMDLIHEAVKEKQEAIAILKQHTDYAQLTQAGPITVLKNGIEFAATYFIMLLALFFYGAGRIVSIDYWIARKFGRA